MATDEEKAKRDANASKEKDDDYVSAESLFQNALKKADIHFHDQDYLVSVFNNIEKQLLITLFHRFMYIINVYRYEGKLFALFNGKNIYILYPSPDLESYPYYTVDVKENVDYIPPILMVYRFSTLVGSIGNYVHSYVFYLNFPQQQLHNVVLQWNFLNPVVYVLHERHINLYLLFNWDCVIMLFRFIAYSIYAFSTSNKLSQQNVITFLQQKEVVNLLRLTNTARDWINLAVKLQTFFKSQPLYAQYVTFLDQKAQSFKLSTLPFF
jgi:hypothetical protein